MPDNFVLLDTVVASILLEIGDEANKRYQLKARQWALDEYRRINVHLSDVYYERKAEIDENNTGQIPDESVKLITVGIYRNGVFDPFVKLPDMQFLPEDMSDGIYDSKSIFPINPDQVLTGGGYWKEDREHSRFFVRNFRQTNNGIEDTTSVIRSKVVIRFRTTGLNLGGDIFIPAEARDFIVASVAHKFMAKSIPVRVTNMVLRDDQAQVDKFREDYMALLYEPGNMYEIRDALFGRT